MKKKFIIMFIIMILLSFKTYANEVDNYLYLNYPHIITSEWRVNQIANGYKMIINLPSCKANMVGYIINCGSNYSPDFYVFDLNGNIAKNGAIIMDIDNDMMDEVICCDKYGKILSNYNDGNVKTNLIGCLLDAYGNVEKHARIK